MTDVQGRTAFVSGGAIGIGLGIARHFAGAGAKVAPADLDVDGLARAIAELEKSRKSRPSAFSNGVHCCTAKVAVVGLSESLRPDLAAAGIGISVLWPGPAATNIIHRSHEDAPKGAARLSEMHEKRRAERSELVSQTLQKGVGIEDVGATVLSGVRGNSLYIHKDRFMEEPIKARTAAILGAMPD